MISTWTITEKFQVELQNSLSYANAIASKMYGRNEWCEFRDKIKAIALKYEPDLMDFGKYESLMKMKLDDYPIE